jgi:hypothetical protein
LSKLQARWVCSGLGSFIAAEQISCSAHEQRPIDVNGLRIQGRPYRSQIEAAGEDRADGAVMGTVVRECSRAGALSTVIQFSPPSVIENSPPPLSLS